MSMQDHMMQSLKHQAEKIEDLESRLAKAREALEKIQRESVLIDEPFIEKICLEALSELKGEK